MRLRIRQTRVETRFHPALYVVECRSCMFWSAVNHAETLSRAKEYADDFQRQWDLEMNPNIVKEVKL